MPTMDETQIQKMRDYNQKERLAVAEMMKSPVNWDEIDKQIQEHFEEHGQVNPNKKER